jgi:hypothetical protein
MSSESGVCAVVIEVMVLLHELCGDVSGCKRLVVGCRLEQNYN